MPRPPLEVADIFRRHAADYPFPLSTCQSRVLAALQVCRTARLGGHAERCSLCDFQRIAYNSCRNRHCPKCQFLAKARWVDKRIADLLPVPYFHLVFTVPQPIAQIALQNRQVVYDILFQASSETLMTIAADPKHLGAQIGFVAVLHTWGQNLHHHPHLHCVVPGGGLSPDDARWVSARPGFFLPVRVLSRLFRRRFLELLTEAHKRRDLQFHGELEHLRARKAFAVFLAQVRRTDWVVYSKRPFGGSEQVVAYVGRYTHRVAISNDRLQTLENGTVTFAWKDYRRPKAGTTLSLTAHEFMRRFLLHTLPRGFVRLRHYGLLANRKRGTKLERCFQLLCPSRSRPLEALQPDWKALYQKLTGHSIDACPKCPGQMSEGEGIPSAKELIEQLGQPGGYIPTSTLSPNPDAEVCPAGRASAQADGPDRLIMIDGMRMTSAKQRFGDHALVGRQNPNARPAPACTQIRPERPSRDLESPSPPNEQISRDRHGQKLEWQPGFDREHVTSAQAGYPKAD